MTTCGSFLSRSDSQTAPCEHAPEPSVQKKRWQTCDCESSSCRQCGLTHSGLDLPPDSLTPKRDAPIKQSRTWREIGLTGYFGLTAFEDSWGCVSLVQ